MEIPKGGVEPHGDYNSQQPLRAQRAGAAPSTSASAFFFPLLSPRRRRRHVPAVLPQRAGRARLHPEEDVPVRQPDLLGAPRPLLPRRPLLAAPPGPQAPLRRPAHPAGAAAALSRDRHRERHRELPPPCPVTPNRRARR